MRPSTRGEGGSVVLWILLLAMVVLFPVGTIGIGLWQAFSTHLALSSAADAAAVAGANGIDANAYRQGGNETGVVKLDPTAAEQLAHENLLSQTDLPGLVAVEIDADADQIEVVLRSKLSLGLLDVFTGGSVDVVARATGRPSLSQ